MSSFAPIHNHSEYSALDGLSTCREIAQRCRDIGCSCCGITDHGTVTGHLEFAKVLKEFEIKPVFGAELYHGVKTTFKGQERDQNHFVAGALNDEGLRNLWRLVDAASTNFRFVGRVNWQMLDKYKEGIFATSACIQGLVSQGVLHEDPYEPLNRYLEIFRDNFYIELHTYPGEEHELLNASLVTIARERGIPLIYATDAHFASPEQYETHDAYVCMQTGARKGETIFTDPENRSMWHPKSLYIQSESEIRASLSYLPKDAVDEALQNSSDLAERCNATLPEIKRHLPTFIPKECPWTSDEEKQLSAADLFMTLVARGIAKRYGRDNEQAWNRALQEAEVFLEAGLEHYFLQAWDFCAFCDSKSIRRGPGRGSAAGAIVAYALGITDIDPLKYDLIFERFYNAGRADGFPDIDNDFPVKERKTVRQYLMSRWGAARVRTIGTVTRLKPKAALDKTYKVCGVTFETKEALKKIIDDVPDIDILGADSIGWHERTDPGKTIYVMHSTKETEHDVGERVEQWIAGYDADDQDIIRNWLHIVEVVCSRVSGYGVHPSGVVVSDVDLDDELPCMWNAKQEVQVTCFPMADVDKRQFVKQDLLGLRNLDTLQDWEDQVAPHIGGPINWSNLEDEDIPESGWQLLDQGLTLGIFQIEKGYARRLCKDFKPRSIEDLSIIVALNRPGPIRSGAPDSFIRRRRGEEEVEYDHPILEDLLAPTYGWFLYQEQVIRFFQRIGYNLSDADAVRKILGKKKPEEMRNLRFGEGDWKDNGYMQAAARAGIPEDVAARIMDKIGDFAKYSFNKSHSVAYGTIAFRTLFAKAYGPAEFIMACIRTNPDDAGDYVAEGRRMGIHVLPPDIQRSQPEIAVVGGDVLFGFSNVKGIGVGTARYICELRDKYPMQSPEDLDRALENEQFYWESERDRAKAEERSFKRRSPRQVCPANRIPPLTEVGAFDAYTDRVVSLTDRQKAEKEYLGVIISDDSEAIFERNSAELLGLDTYADIEVNPRVQIPGVVATITPKRTKKDDKPMGIVSVEYQGDQAEFVVFPREWTAYRFLWKERTPAIFTLSRTERGVRFESAHKLS